MMIAMLLALAGQSQMEMTMKAGRDAASADAAMNAQYRQTMAAMKKMDGYRIPNAGPSYADALLAAQRAWLAYRDAECLVGGYEFRSGSAEGMAGALCKAKLTRARTSELKIEMWQK